MTCGIYVLYYETDDFQYYVGKSICIENRYKEHCSKLKNNTHKNIALKEGNIKYGLPTLSILEVTFCDDNIMYSKEIEWIALFDSFHNGMNETPGGAGTGYGEDNPVAIYSNEKIIHLVKYIISNTNLTLKEVSKTLDINYGVVTSIAQGNKHFWLAEAIPEEYARLLSLNNTRRRGELSGKSRYSNQEIKEVLISLAAGISAKDTSKNLCIEVDTVYGVFASRTHLWLKQAYPTEYLKMTKLYQLTKPISKWPPILSPEGTVYRVSRQDLFSKEHGIDNKRLSDILIGKRKEYQGWRLASPKEANEAEHKI